MPICDCGRQTGNPEGICVICEMDAKHPGLVNEVRGGDPVANVPKEKICIQCQKPYAPTSSAQKRCSECGRLAKIAKDKSYREAKKGLVAPKRKIQKQQAVSKVSHDGDSGIIQELIKQRGLIDTAIEVIRRYA